MEEGRLLFSAKHRSGVLFVGEISTSARGVCIYVYDIHSE